MTPPIPRRMLPSSCAVREPLDDGGFGGRYGEERKMRFVRFESSDDVRATEYQLRDGPKGTLFVDAVSTVGAFAVTAGSLVSVDGSPPVAATSCVPCQDGMGRVHHWEVALG